MSQGIQKKEPLAFLIIHLFHLFYRPVSVYKAQGIPKNKHLTFMIIPLYKVIPCCKTNCYDIPEFVHQTNFVQIYTKDKQEGVSKGKENSENTKAARHMQGTSGPRDSGLRRHFRESVR